MRFRDAFHANVALAVAAIFGGFLGAGLLTNHHPMAGTILTSASALWLGGWIATMPRTPSLLRFWLLVFLCAGTMGFLLQEWDDEQRYQLTSPIEAPAAGIGRPAQAASGLAQVVRPGARSQSGRSTGGLFHDTLDRLGWHISQPVQVAGNR